MGETVPLISPSFNASVSIETRREHLSADTGALVQRELMERSGIIEWLDERLDVKLYWIARHQNFLNRPRNL